VNYLEEHPDAMDTIEGIAEFWVLRSLIRVEVNTLVRVLSQLTEQGVIEEVTQGKHSSYRLRKPSG
jgi:hypothetical protein